MNKEIVFWGAGGVGAFLLFLFLKGYEDRQQERLYMILTTQSELQREIRGLEKSLDFMKNQNQKLLFLEKKGWIIPANRLTASEVIKKVGQTLKTLHITSEPEVIKTYGGVEQGKVTKIVLECGAFLDTDIYVFIQELMIAFPGILVPTHMTFVRKSTEVDVEERICERKRALILGTLVFDWVALGGPREAS